MERKVFVSYRHTEAEWVRHRLVPTLKTVGCHVLVDDEWFRAGERLRDEIEHWQNEAARSVLVLTPEYFESKWCKEELKRAVRLRNGIALVRSDCAVPKDFQDELWVDLKEPEAPRSWGKLFESTGAPGWLSALERTKAYLGNGQSVNLIAHGQHIWQALVQWIERDLGRPIGLVDLEDWRTVTRAGFLRVVAQELSLPAPSLANGDDLIQFGEALHHSSGQRLLAVAHFDMAPYRNDFDVNLFAGLRHAIMKTRKIVLFAHSKSEFAALLPRDHPLSHIDLKTVELLGPQL